MTAAGLGKSLGAAGAGGLMFAAFTQNPAILMIVGVVGAAAFLAALTAVIVVVLTSALSSDSHRQPNATATLDRLIYALLGWRRPATRPPAPTGENRRSAQR